MPTGRLRFVPRSTRRRPSGPASALGAALDRAGDRWLLLVVDALVDGPQRYGDLTGRVGAASNVLADRLRRLETDGLVVSRPYSERPVRFTYELTAEGRSLAEALVPLAAWGAAAEGRLPTRFHEACGTGIELRPWCPTCDRPMSDEITSSYDL